MENTNTPTNISEWLNETSSSTKKSFRDSQEYSVNETRKEIHQYQSIPQLLISGVTIKHGGKEGKQAVVPRYCIVRLTRVEIFEKLKTGFVFAIRMGKTKKIIRSTPIELFEEKQIVLDFCFGFHYLHSMKPPYDILRIYIEETQKKKTKEHKILAHADINMALVLQHPLDDEVTLLSRKDPKLDREERRLEKREEKEQKRQEKEAKKREKQNLKEGTRVTTGPVVVSNERQKEVEDLTSSAQKDIVKDLNESKDRKPFATVQVSITLYPEEVDSPQDAQEWEDELMDAVMIDVRDEMNESDEEELFDSDVDSEDELFSPVLSDDGRVSPTLLSDQMRSRYRRSSKFQDKRLPRFSNFKKYLKFPKQNKTSSPVPETEDGNFANLDDVSLGASTAEEEAFSNEEYESPIEPGNSTPPSSRKKVHEVIVTPSIVIGNQVLTRSQPTPIIYSKVLTPRDLSAENSPNVSRKLNNISVTGVVEPTPPTSPSVKPFLKQITDTTLLLFIDTQKKKGKKLEEILREMPDNSPKMQVFPLKTNGDVFSILQGVVSKIKSESSDSTLRVAIAGGDGFMNTVLRAYVDLSAKKPKGWQEFKFFLLPIGNKNDVAHQIASVDPVYRSLFFTNEWKALEKNDLNEDEIAEVHRRMFRYLDEAIATYPLPIGEALLSVANSNNNPTVQKNVPFIKGIQIGIREPTDQAVEQNDPTENLQIDFWIPKKKGEAHKEVKSFQFAAVTRLPSVATALHIEPDHKPTPMTFSLLIQLKDKSKKEKMKEAFTTRLGLSEKKEEGVPHTSSKINRMVVTAAGETMFKVLIDGIEYTNVKLVSLSPEWQSHVKMFQIQIFKVQLVISQPVLIIICCVIANEILCTLSDESFAHIDKNNEHAFIDFTGSLTQSFIGKKPPKEIPEQFKDDFTMNGKVKIEKFYIDESAGGKGTFLRFSLSDIEGYINKAKLSQSISASSKSSQFLTDTWFFQSLKEFPIVGKDVAIIGSQAPWFESICIANGASSVTTIEYNKLQYEHPKMKTLTVQNFLESPRKFDIIIAISCIEHDGLGRYGDPIDPFADVKSMEFLKCILKDGGKLFFGVPIGPDAVTWNMGRRYGINRLPLLLKGWKVLKKIGWDEGALQRDVSTRQLYVPIQILEPE